MPKARRGRSRDSNIPPDSVLFRDAPGASPRDIGANPWTEEDLATIARLKGLINADKLGGKFTEQGQIPQFLPYLVVRSFVGDNGTRGDSSASWDVSWESPDIWTAPGEPVDAPAIPSDHGYGPAGVAAGGPGPTTVYALVWNLGRVPLTGVVVAFYWADPAWSFNPDNLNLIGMARTELGARSSPLCRKLVKCPVAWMPVEAGFGTLLVRVSGFGDAPTPNVWEPFDRHVAVRSCYWLADIDSARHVIEQLLTQPLNKTSQIELTQVDSKAAANVVRIAAPNRIPAAGILAKTLAMFPVGTKADSVINAIRDGANAIPFKPGTAYILRLTQKDCGKTIGGYTLVLTR